ncbi:unnamed protein product [Leuciscus chuanchicus]
MSKLKRKKLSVEESRSEQHSRIKKSNDSLCTVTLQDSGCIKTSNVTARERWWESSELSDAERLWALTLRALCPSLQSDQEESIPQLPPPSSTTTLVQKVSDWKWCSANEVADPPPDLPAPSFLTHSPPVNDCKNPSQPPAEKNIGESDSPALADQENCTSSPDQESVSGWQEIQEQVDLDWGKEQNQVQKDLEQRLDQDWIAAQSLLIKRKHYVETWQTVSVLKERRKRNSKKDSYSSERVKKSPDSCEVREQRSFGVVGSAERRRTRQCFVGGAGLACASARSLPAVCTLARLQSTAEHRRPRERDTMSALVKGRTDRERGRYRERVSEGVDTRLVKRWKS